MTRALRWVDPWTGTITSVDGLARWSRPGPDGPGRIISPPHHSYGLNRPALVKIDTEHDHRGSFVRPVCECAPIIGLSAVPFPPRRLGPPAAGTDDGCVIAPVRRPHNAISSCAIRLLNDYAYHLPRPGSAESKTDGSLVRWRRCAELYSSCPPNGHFFATAVASPPAAGRAIRVIRGHGHRPNDQTELEMRHPQKRAVSMKG